MHKKTTILIVLLILLSIILLFFSIIIFRNFQLSKNCLDSYQKFAEKNDKTIFTIDKITYFSSCSANINTNSNSSFTISDLYQYTDIAIFINNNVQNNEYTAENTLKEVCLNNINFSLKPNVGNPNLYYKNINDFAKSTYTKDSLIQDNISFETTAEDTIDYSKPILYNNCANPITLSYVNSNIKDNFTLNDKISNISHNGSLLKSCGVTLNSIACQVSFTINIINNLDEIFTCPITLNVPLSTESSTIYDGSLTFKDITNYNFIRK